MAQENKTNVPANGAAEKSSAAPATSPVNVLNDDTKIVVEALVPAVYYTCSVTFETFSWLEVGDTQEMTYRQLRIMKSKHPRYFTEKWLLPKNDEVVKKLNLDKVYAIKITRNEFKVFYGDDVSSAEKLLVSISGETRNEVLEKFKKNVESGKVTNVKMIRLFEKQFDVDLMDLV